MSELGWFWGELAALAHVAIALAVTRVKRRALRLRRERSHMFLVDEVAPDAPEAGPLTPLEYAIGRLTGLSAESGNAVSLVRNGDKTYPAMLEAIEGAKRSIGLASYIFRDDEAGLPFIQALIR